MFVFLFLYWPILYTSLLSLFSQLLDTSVIIGSVLIVSLLDGTAKVTELPGQTIVLYNKIAEPTSVRELVEQFPQVFRPGVQASRFNLQT